MGHRRTPANPRLNLAASRVAADRDRARCPLVFALLAALAMLPASTGAEVADGQSVILPGSSGAEVPDSQVAAVEVADGQVTDGQTAAAVAEDGEEPERSRFSFDAFGTLGFIYSSEDQADFAWLPTRPNGPGYSESVSLETDSVFGAQATFYASPKLTAVVQVAVEQDAEDDHTPHLEWANLRYEVTPEFIVRVGRVALPAFMVSEYRKVSFANPWVRPPIELYGMVPVFTIDGVKTTYLRHSGDWTNTLGLTVGRSEAEMPGDLGTVDAEKAWNTNFTFQRNGFTGRLAGAGGVLDIDAFDPFFDAFRAFGHQGDAIADRFEIDERRFRFASAGVDYDAGPWFAMAELGWMDSDSALGEKVAGYVTGGFRWGSVTPYATYSRSEMLSDTSHPGLSLAGLPPEVVPMAAGLNAGLNAFLQFAPAQQNLAIGGRWDLATGAALKLQIDFIDALGNSPGTFINWQPGFEPGGRSNVVSLATVFVF